MTMGWGGGYKHSSFLILPSVLSMDQDNSEVWSTPSAVTFMGPPLLLFFMVSLVSVPYPHWASSLTWPTSTTPCRFFQKHILINHFYTNPYVRLCFWGSHPKHVSVLNIHYSSS